MSFKSLGMTVETLLGMKTNAWFRYQYYEKPDILFSMLYANEPSPFLISGSLNHHDFWVIRSLENPNFPQPHPTFHGSESHRSLSCPLGLLLCFMVPAMSSLTQWPSFPSGHSVPHPPFLASWTIFIPSRLSIAFQLCWAHLSDTGSPNVLVESKLPVPHLSPPPVCIFPYSWDSAVPWEEQDCGRWGPGGWTRSS